MKIEAIGIIGSDSSSCGVAVSMAAKGLQVRMYDLFKDNLTMAVARMEWQLDRMGRRDCIDNIETVQDLKTFGGADFVVETEAKSEDERMLIYKKLNDLLSPDCGIGLNCGGGLVQPLAQYFNSPERLVGINFVAPVSKTGLVEVIRLDTTADECVAGAADMCRGIDKTVVLLRDNPGGMVERLRRPYHLAALRLLELGKGLPHQIDRAAKEIGGCSAGPLETIDRLGIDRDYQNSDILYKLFNSPERLKPSFSEDRLVQYGQVGKKTSAGFYIYEEGEIAGENPALRGIVHYLGIKILPDEEIFVELVRPVIDEAKMLASEIMASEFDIETAVRLGLGWSKGPFTLSREMGTMLSSTAKTTQDEWGDAI